MVGELVAVVELGLVMRMLLGLEHGVQRRKA
jgi:hypothetical protein